MRWIFDANRADFRPALSGEIEADPDALSIIQHGDVLIVREDGHERPMPERLDVAGVMFDREQFAAVIPNETTMREARTGNLKSFDSVGALMADLQHAPEGGAHGMYLSRGVNRCGGANYPIWLRSATRTRRHRQIWPSGTQRHRPAKKYYEMDVTR